MPKVVIREFDWTEAGFVPTNNFSVAIPGFVAADKQGSEYNDAWDMNNVHQCSSVTDFETYIGKCTTIDTQVPAKGPALTSFVAADAEPDPETGVYPVTTYGKVTGAQFYSTFADQVYTRAANSTHTIGKLKSNDYIYTKASVWDASGEYSIILTGDEGTDASATAVEQTHLGNQIAYLLLTLGYTIYYKKITAFSELVSASTYECFKDRSVYDIRYIMHGLITDTEVNSVTYKVADANTAIYSVANALNNTVDTGRGDCIALQDISRSVYAGKSLNQAINDMPLNIGSTGTYGAVFAPSVTYSGVTDGDKYTNDELPGSFHYLACAATAFNRYAEWYAVSGYTRGVCGLSIVSPSYIFGDKAVQKLQQRGGSQSSINLIIKLRNSYYLWGNRTGKPSGGGLIASNFLNIRQLCCTLKKAIYTTCRQLMFDPNSDVLWTNFCGALRPTLENMKNNQGIKDYQFVKLETSLKAKLFATVRIIPIEAVEDFEIAVYMEDNFDNATITLTEILTNAEE